MNFSALLKNRAVLIAIIAVVVLAAVFIFMSISKSQEGPRSIGDEKVIEEKTIKSSELELLTTDNIGKALEIQSLLARERIRVDKVADGSKYKLVLSKTAQWLKETEPF
ncbi:MAG: hypothetical protein MZU97_09210 [Bacillus subtilis]|nr:hypothetical protein [Bacillus subtilis]